MIKEVVISDAYARKSFARLTRMKWLVAAILVIALALGWLASKPVRTTDVTETIELPMSGDPAASTGRPAAAPSTATAANAAAPTPRTASRATAEAPTKTATPAVPSGPSLILERWVDGRIIARGIVADASVRDQWLNAIRIGAQGSRVEADIEVASVAASAPWDERLRQLTALTTDRRLDQIHLEGERLILQGPAVATSYRQDTERLFRAQLPDQYRVEYRTVNPSTASRSASSASAPASGASTDAAASATQAPVRQAQPVAASERQVSTADCPARLDKLAANVYFRTDSTSLSRAERERLTTLGRCMRNRRISVVGFADSRHNSQYNLDLAMRRAQSVADAIRAEAPEGASITTSSVGAELGKSTRDARMSRRVEIRVR